MTGASNIRCWRKSKWFPMYVEITMSHCRNHILYKMLLNLCQFSRKWFLKRFRMIHSLFASQVSPWHSFILKKSKRFFGVLSWADSHRGAILVLVIKKLPGFFLFWGIEATWTVSCYSVAKILLIIMKVFKFHYKKWIQQGLLLKSTLV